MKRNTALVGLVGQLNFNESQVTIVGKRIYTKDGVKIGVLLNNGKAFIK